MVLRLPFAILNPADFPVSKGENLQRLYSAFVEAARAQTSSRLIHLIFILAARKNEGSFSGQGKEQWSFQLGWSLSTCCGTDALVECLGR